MTTRVTEGARRENARALKKKRNWLQSIHSVGYLFLNRTCLDPPDVAPDRWDSQDITKWPVCCPGHLHLYIWNRV